MIDGVADEVNDRVGEILDHGLVDLGFFVITSYSIHYTKLYDGRHPVLALIAWCMNLRSRLTGIATGDQAIFVTRSAFEAVLGFPDQPLMEDIALSTELKFHGRSYNFV